VIRGTESENGERLSPDRIQVLKQNRSSVGMDVELHDFQELSEMVKVQAVPFVSSPVAIQRPVPENRQSGEGIRVDDVVPFAICAPGR